MHYNGQEIDTFLQNMLATRQKAQILRVRDHWEPEIVRSLTSLADASLALLRQHLSASGSGGGRDSQWLADQLVALKDQHTQRALALLTEMASKEGQVTSEICAFDGLAPGLEELGLSAEKLAGVPVLKESVERAYKDYLRRVRAVLQQARTSGASLDRVSQALEEPTRIWRNSLKRVGVTLTHAVFNRAKVEVGMIYIRRAA